MKVFIEYKFEIITMQIVSCTVIETPLAECHGDCHREISTSVSLHRTHHLLVLSHILLSGHLEQEWEMQKCQEMPG